MHAAENFSLWKNIKIQQDILAFWLIRLRQQSAIELFVDKQCSINQVDYSRDVTLSVFQGHSGHFGKQIS